MKKTENNKLLVNIQLVCSENNIPTLKQFRTWLKAALHSQAKKIQHAEVNIRIVDENESANLNKMYRHKIGPTNILAFSYNPPPETQIDLLGDLVVCAPIVLKEAKDQHKNIEAHWTHLIIHGCLHLLGYDHVQTQEADIMEALEIQILQKLGLDNPYIETTVT
jgi:probable rRNA maturation factor